MDWQVVLKGGVLGFSIAAPIGAIGLLCIRRTIECGFIGGFVTGLGAAFADALYGCLTTFGLSVISDFVYRYSSCFNLAGGIFMIYLAVKMYFSFSQETAAIKSEKNLVKGFVCTFLLTLVNPATIFSFIAIILSMGINTSDYQNSFLIIAGIFCGSALWWFILSMLVSRLDSLFNPIMIVWISRTAAIVVGIFGIQALIHGFSGFRLFG